MKINFKNEKLGLEGALELDLKDVIELTKFVMENKEELKELNLELIDHLEEVLLKLFEKFKTFKTLEETFRGENSHKIIQVPIEKNVEIKECEEETESKVKELSQEQLAVLLSTLAGKL